MKTLLEHNEQVLRIVYDGLRARKTLYSIACELKTAKITKGVPQSLLVQRLIDKFGGTSKFLERMDERTANNAPLADSAQRSRSVKSLTDDEWQAIVDARRNGASLATALMMLNLEDVKLNSVASYVTHSGGWFKMYSQYPIKKSRGAT